MDGDNAINKLLLTFQEFTKRGDTASLFLETRDGLQYGTLRVKLPVSKEPGTPDTKSYKQARARVSKSKSKSPSTLRRDKERLAGYKMRKTIMNTSHSSTPKLLPEQASSVKEDHTASEEDDDPRTL